MRMESVLWLSDFSQPSAASASAGKLLGSVQLTKCSSSLHACSPDETGELSHFYAVKICKSRWSRAQVATQPQHTTKLFGVAGVCCCPGWTCISCFGQRFPSSTAQGSVLCLICRPCTVEWSTVGDLCTFWLVPHLFHVGLGTSSAVIQDFH